MFPRRRHEGSRRGHRGRRAAERTRSRSRAGARRRARPALAVRPRALGLPARTRRRRGPREPREPMEPRRPRGPRGRAPGKTVAPDGSGTSGSGTSGDEREELAALAWPEAAGTAPDQREALELAVRHHLAPREVAAVLGLERNAALELLASAACEVERTRAALAVVELGRCRVVARLAGAGSCSPPSSAASLSNMWTSARSAVDRRTRHRGRPWPARRRRPPRSRCWRPARRPGAAVAAASGVRPPLGGGPRFDRRGFPLHPRTVPRAAVGCAAGWSPRRSSPRSWPPRRSRCGPRTAACRRTPTAAPRRRSRPGTRSTCPAARTPLHAVRPVRRDRWSAGGADSPRRPLAGRDRARRARRRVPRGRPPAAVGATGREAAPADLGPDRRRRPPRGGPPDRSAAPGAGLLTVEARPDGERTAVTLRASGGAPVRWSASADARGCG
ncbi:hypothetical protein NKH77_29845 [Streptomyces sp. M19]